VDSPAVQDGFQVYYHTFLFTPDGPWAVVQQGLTEESGMARRCHRLTPSRFDFRPPSGRDGRANGKVLNLMASEAVENWTVSAELARRGPAAVVPEIERMRSLSISHRHECS